MDIAKEKWNKLRETLDNASQVIDLDTFIHHFWMSRYGYVSRKKLFKEIKQHVKDNNDVNLLEQLLSDAQTYREIVEPELRDWNSNNNRIKMRLDALNLLNVAQPRPLVLSLIRAFDNSSLSVAIVDRYLQTIENFYFQIYEIVDKSPSGWIGSMFSAYARQINNNQDSNLLSRNQREMAVKLRNNKPTIEEFKASFSTLAFSRFQSQRKNKVKYVLQKIYRSQNPNSPVDLDALTIEHIAPESGRQYKKVDNSNVARIGNLILVDSDLNDKLADRPFCEKLEIFKEESSVHIDPFVLESNEWDDEAIYSRTEKMANYAFETVWDF